MIDDRAHLVEARELVRAPDLRQPRKEKGVEEEAGCEEAEGERWSLSSRTLSRLVLQQLLAGAVRPYLRLVRVLHLDALCESSDVVGLFERMNRPFRAVGGK